MGYDLRFSGLKPKLKYIMVGIKLGKSHVPEESMTRFPSSSLFLQLLLKGQSPCIEPRLPKNYHRNHKRICRREGRALFTGHKTSVLQNEEGVERDSGYSCLIM